MIYEPPEKVTSSCFIEKYRLLRLDYEENLSWNEKKFFNFFIGRMSHPEKAVLSCYFGNDQLLSLKYYYKKRLKSKNKFEKTFIIECMSHPEKVTSSCFIENYRNVRFN